MKKVISLMLALVLALSLTACGGKAGPEGVVGRFCKGLQELDEEAIAQCFENGDDLELSDLEDVDSDDAVAQKIMDFMKSCAGRLKYQVGEATVGGDTATVPVEFTYVNAGTLMTEILTEYISQAWSLALSGADDEKLAAAFEEVFDEKTTGGRLPHPDGDADHPLCPDVGRLEDLLQRRQQRGSVGPAAGHPHQQHLWGAGGLRRRFAGVNSLS